MPLLLVLAVACAPKPSVIRGDRLVKDLTQTYNAAAGVSAGAAKHWLGSAQGWGPGPQAGLVSERAYPGDLAWWMGVGWSSHALLDATGTFEGGHGEPLTDTATEGQQVLYWGETGIQYSPDRGWNTERLGVRLFMRGTLALGAIQTQMDLPYSGGRTRLETTDLLVAPNGHVGLQFIWKERWDMRLLCGAAPVAAFDRAELGGGDNGRVTLRTHATLETLVRF